MYVQSTGTFSPLNNIPPLLPGDLSPHQLHGQSEAPVLVSRISNAITDMDRGDHAGSLCVGAGC